MSISPISSGAFLATSKIIVLLPAANPLGGLLGLVLILGAATSS